MMLHCLRRQPENFYEKYVNLYSEVVKVIIWKSRMENQGTPKIALKVQNQAICSLNLNVKRHEKYQQTMSYIFNNFICYFFTDLPLKFEKYFCRVDKMLNSSKAKCSNKTLN